MAFVNRTHAALLMTILLLVSFLPSMGTDLREADERTPDGTPDQYSPAGTRADTVAPVYGADNSPLTGTTGENHMFNVTVTDDVGIHDSKVEYWYGTGGHFNTTMDGLGPYTLNVTIPSGSTDNLHYFFWANDSADNFAKTAQANVPITDNDNPAFGSNFTASAGTTGDEFTFLIMVSDNVGVNTAWTEFWVAGGTHYNWSMNNSGVWSLTMDIPDNSTDTLYYKFRANDSAGNTITSTYSNITITDNDKPFFGEDRSPAAGTTGDAFEFKVIAYDNIGISSMKVEYWYGTGTHQLANMSGGPVFTKTIGVQDNTTGDLNYFFRAQDAAGNWNVSTNGAATITDNDNPTTGVNTTPSTGYTGDEFTFTVMMDDNIGVNTVWTEFWFGSGTHFNFTMNNTGAWTLTIDLPPDSIDTLHYKFRANDTALNSMASTYSNVTILDNDKPSIGADGSDAAATTGDQFSFSINANDNIAVQEARVVYWYGAGGQFNVTMTGPSPFTKDVATPQDSTDTLHYYFYIVDAAGNWNITSVTNVGVSDNDIPVFGVDTTPAAGGTGDQFTFSIPLSDNVGLAQVLVEYWYGAGTHYKWAMNGSSPATLTLDLPTSSLDTLHYNFSAQDTSGNWNNTGQEDVPISDNDKPTFGTDNTPAVATAGTQFTFSVNVNDNMGVNITRVEYWFGSDPHLNWTLNGTSPATTTIDVPADETDTLHYYFFADDAAGNLRTGSQKDVPLFDEEKPVFGTNSTAATAGTGNKFTFNITVTDNLAVSTVTVEYWFGVGTPTNVSMTGPVNYTYVIDIASDETDDLHYIFHAVDQASNWNQTAESVVTVVDAEGPVFGTDSTPTTGKATKSINFKIEITDTIDGDPQQAWVEYWFDPVNVTHYNLSMTKKGGSSIEWELKNINLPGLSNLYYTVRARDIAGNWANTTVKMVLVSDGEAPQFIADNSPATGTTGETYMWSVIITDNIQVKERKVIYWFASGGPQNNTMDGEGPYTYNVSIPVDDTAVLHYYFYAEDTSGEWNITSVKHITIYDNDWPVWGTNSTDGAGTTGDPFTFDIDLSDNMEIHTVTVEFWYGSGTHYNWTLNGTYPWTLTEDLPSDTTDTMHYIFHANDTGGNWINSTETLIPITDNDNPWFSNDQTPITETAGTGITFKIDVFDNIGIANVYLEYWYNAGSHDNETMGLSTGGVLPYREWEYIPHSTTGTLHYFFSAVDVNGLWRTTAVKDITITDDTPPDMVNDTTPDIAYTGDQFTFDIEVTDGVGVSWVTCEFWFGSGTHYDWAMNDTGTWTLTIDVPSDSLDTLYYIFHTTDAASNDNQTTQENVPVLDNDWTVFGTDSTPSSGTTGEQITFSIVITDNIGIQFVMVEYWFGTGTHNNGSMSGSGTYTKTIDIPSGSTATLHYIFHASDTSAQWNETGQKDVTISDNDKPVFGADNTPGSGTTGEQLAFSIAASDNIGVLIIKVEYWFGSGGHTNTSLGGFGPYTLNLGIPSNVIDTLHYFFYVEDADGNMEVTAEKDITITDNDKPAFGSDGTPSTATTGEQHTFSIVVSDNIGVTSVSVVYWFTGGGATNTTMTGAGTYTKDMAIPSDSERDLHYYFYTIDAAGNWNIFTQEKVTVNDNDIPVFGTDATPDPGTTGEQFTFSIVVNDNIALHTVKVEYWYTGGGHLHWAMNNTGTYTLTIDIPPGSEVDLHYIFHANDSAGNSDSTVQVDITINDNDPPVLFNDATPTDATTGQQALLSIMVTDNIGVHTVEAEFWFGSGTHYRWLMNGTVTFTLAIDIPEDSTDTLYYIFHANDSAQNTGQTVQEDIIIHHNTPPTFSNDVTPFAGTTGDEFIFNVTVNDTVGVTEVTVEYWFGAGSPVNITMDGAGPFYLAVFLPSGSTAMLYYFFHAVNVAGIWNTTTPIGVTITDNDNPVFGTDTTPTTGYTGDQFAFAIPASDNIAIGKVTVEYWFGTGSHANVSMSGAGTYSKIIVVPSGSVATMHYRFHVGDTAGNWVHTAPKDVPVLDNDKPIFGTDYTPSAGTTGDELTFTIAVTDNIGISNVTVEYWFGTKNHNNVTMKGSGPYTYKITVPAGSIDTLSYRFKARDAAGNPKTSNPKAVPITDNDPIVFGEDSSPKIGKSGETLQFMIEVTDNIGVKTVKVEYWFGTGFHNYQGLSGNGPYYLTIDVPSTTQTLHYYFYGADSRGNYNETLTRDIPISDDKIKPVFTVDGTPESGTTGDPFTFSIFVTDNKLVTGVTVEYWYGTGNHTNRSMTGGRGAYILDITAPSNSTDLLYYFFRATDAAGNWNTTALKNVTIKDNDKPELGKDSTPTAGTTGDELVFTIGAYDNVGIETLEVEYWFGNGDHSTKLMEGAGQYTLAINVRSGSTATLHYIMTARDAAGNEGVTAEEEVPITDNDAPSSDAGSSFTATVGSEVPLDGSKSTDNINIVNYTWSFEYEEQLRVLYGMAVSFTFGVTGTYEVTLKVLDKAGNTGTDTVEVTVLSEDAGSSFGVLTDDEGNVLTDTEVTVEIDGQTFVVTTDEEGRLNLSGYENITLGDDINISVGDEDFTGSLVVGDDVIEIDTDDEGDDTGEGTGTDEDEGVMGKVANYLWLIVLLIIIAIAVPSVIKGRQRHKEAVLAAWDDASSVTVGKKTSAGGEEEAASPGEAEETVAAVDPTLSDEDLELMDAGWDEVGPYAEVPTGKRLPEEMAGAVGKAAAAERPGEAGQAAPKVEEPPPGPPPLFHSIFRPSWEAGPADAAAPAKMAGPEATKAAGSDRTLRDLLGEDRGRRSRGTPVSARMRRVRTPPRRIPPRRRASGGGAGGKGAPPERSETLKDTLVAKPLVSAPPRSIRRSSRGK